MLRKLLNKLVFKNQNQEYLERILYENNYNRLYRLAYSITKDKYTAQDVVQETFIKAFEKLHTLKDEEKFESWLAIICSRKAKDFLRKSKQWNDFAAEDIFISNELTKHDQSLSIESIIEKKFLKKLIGVCQYSCRI